MKNFESANEFFLNFNNNHFITTLKATFNNTLQPNLCHMKSNVKSFKIIH